MIDGTREPDSASSLAQDFPEAPVLPGDVASAGRSCSAILIMLAVLGLLICVILGVRWYGGA
jgi:hypothetical protein